MNPKLFKDVNSLNRFVSDTKYQVELQRLLLSNVSGSQTIETKYSDEERAIRNRIVGKITSYDLFLLIKTNVLGESIEFQFQLFKTVKGSNDQGNIPHNVSDALIESENIFINPKNSGYEQELINTLRKLFPESNVPPEAKLRIFGKEIKTGATLKIPMNTSIVIDGSQSGDFETENLQYVWTNIGLGFETKQQQSKVNFSKENSSIQRITIENFGFYRISFKVYDGSAFSNEIVVEFSPARKPEVKFYDTTFTSKEYQGLLTQLSFNRERKFHAKFEIHTSDKLLVLKENLAVVSENEVYDFYKDTTSTVATDGIDYLDINNDFPFDETTSVRYVFAVDENKFLGSPNKVSHHLIRRKVANFHVTGLLSKTEDGRYKDSVYYRALTPEVGLGIFVSKNIEVIVTFPLILKEGAFEKGILELPGKARTNIRYHFYEKESKTSLPGFNSFYAELTYNSINVKEVKGYVHSLGAGLGLCLNLYTFPSFSLNGAFGLHYSKFLDNDFSNTFEIGLKFGTFLNF